MAHFGANEFSVIIAPYHTFVNKKTLFLQMKTLPNDLCHFKLVEKNPTFWVILDIILIVNHFFDLKMYFLPISGENTS